MTISKIIVLAVIILVLFHILFYPQIEAYYTSLIIPNDAEEQTRINTP